MLPSLQNTKLIKASEVDRILPMHQLKQTVLHFYRFCTQQDQSMTKLEWSFCL